MHECATLSRHGLLCKNSERERELSEGPISDAARIDTNYLFGKMPLKARIGTQRELEACRFGEKQVSETSKQVKERPDE